jgi:hypothetical protein
MEWSRQACSGGLPTVSQQAASYSRWVTPPPMWCDGDGGDRRRQCARRRCETISTELRQRDRSRQRDTTSTEIPQQIPQQILQQYYIMYRMATTTTTTAHPPKDPPPSLYPLLTHPPPPSPLLFPTGVSRRCETQPRPPLRPSLHTIQYLSLAPPSRHHVTSTIDSSPLTPSPIQYIAPQPPEQSRAETDITCVIAPSAG